MNEPRDQSTDPVLRRGSIGRRTLEPGTLPDVSKEPRHQTTEPDGQDTSEQQAYRCGKSAGYSEGIADGWDACMRHVQSAFDVAISAALAEPAAVRNHREAVRARRENREVAETP